MSTAPWDKLLRFINGSGARGHTRDTIDDLTRIFEKRRWAEEDRMRLQDAQKSGRQLLSKHERAHAASQRRLRNQQTLRDLRELAPHEFEQFVADLFVAQGYNATPVGGVADDGIDVCINSADGNKWAVAQCKRYGALNRISARTIRDFGGAFMLSGAKKGFFFTTSELTRHAKRTAQGYPWLTTYNGPRLVAFVEQLKQTYDSPGS